MKIETPPPTPSAEGPQSVPELKPLTTVNDAVPQNGYQLYSDDRTTEYSQSQAYGREEQQ